MNFTASWCGATVVSETRILIGRGNRYRNLRSISSKKALEIFAKSSSLILIGAPIS